MALNRTRLDKCRSRLINLTRREKRIPYGKMQTHLGLRHHLNLGPYLDAIYEEDRKHDLTLILHYKNSEFGRYNSRGGPARSVPFDPKNRRHVRAYRADLRRLFRYWKNR